VGLVTKEVLKKATGLVHIRSSRQLTLIERKLSNILLNNAYSLLTQKTSFEIPVMVILKSLGWESSKDVTYLKKALGNLVRTLVEFNVFEKDKRANSWEVMTLLSSAKIKDGVCRYSYSECLIEKVLDSGIYAKLDLEVCRKFKNKNAHTLWEFFLECLCTLTNERQIHSPWITMDDFLDKILNKKNKNVSFKKINYQYIKKSIEEINKLSNIIVLDTEFEKKDRGVCVRFLIAWADVHSSIKTSVSHSEEIDHDLILEYAEIKAQKSPKAYANVVKKSLKNGETTMDSIREFLDIYKLQKVKKESIKRTTNDDKFTHIKLELQWEKLNESQKRKLTDQAINNLKRRGFKNIEKESIANKWLIRQTAWDLMQHRVVKNT
jgi:hypothetical protein